MAIDTGKLQEFLGRFIADLGATIAAGNVVIGHRLGLYQALAAGPARPDELADRTGTSTRYIAEWLSCPQPPAAPAAASSPFQTLQKGDQPCHPSPSRPTPARPPPGNASREGLADPAAERQPKRHHHHRPSRTSAEHLARKIADLLAEPDTLARTYERRSARPSWTSACASVLHTFTGRACQLTRVSS